MEHQIDQTSFRPPHVQLRPSSHAITPSSGQPTPRTYRHRLTSNEVLSLASRQKQLLEARVAIARLNKELPDLEYSAYAFLREFTAHSARQCALPEGFVVCSTNELGARKFGLHPELLNPLLASLAVLQDVIDDLEETLPASKDRKPFRVDAESFWTERLDLANNPDKVTNAAAALHTKVHMAFARIQRVLLLHQGHTIDEAEVDQTSHHEWGSMASSPRLEALWNSPRNPVGALVMEDSRRELLGAVKAEGRGTDLGDTAVYPVADSKENRQFVSAWNSGIRRFEGMTRLE